MISFKKYNSIENSYDKEFVEHITLAGFGDMTFVVQEKVHGANFCFVTDGELVYPGKRTGFVEEGESFYGHEELTERYRPNILKLFTLVKSKYPETMNMTVFGEMFGGNYPHPDVKNDRKILNIQKGVYYCPFHEFYAFDLFVSNDDNARYLPLDETNELLEATGFFYAKTLFRGSLDECMRHPNDFPSRISEWIGLPPIDDNICEGIVIRPVEPIYLHNGARVLLKSKNSKFAEKQTLRNRPKPESPVYSEALKTLFDVSDEYVTENRLNNVVSKIGTVSMPKDTGKLIGLLSKDILDDFLKEHATPYAELDKAEQKTLNKHISAQAAVLIKHVYFTI
jgi:Rnl2 family RNA ligase